MAPCCQVSKKTADSFVLWSAHIQVFRPLAPAQPVIKQHGPPGLITMRLQHMDMLCGLPLKVAAVSKLHFQGTLNELDLGESAH
eukprot:CAMPEP_0172759546 /NCGR_PEP_ID=MMETSP1074-20121228/167938_1 /TAXON_ID=2916 /ORGANISM="Ceratium fusus, Strain PA161109" /LENGTH=83 /DNA_ID=CAMNT_0013593367 /DNA_START=450 /DNA_END=701 /DNA_ORIENTATION=-